MRIRLWSNSLDFSHCHKWEEANEEEEEYGEKTERSQVSEDIHNRWRIVAPA